jgi:hypothetical protein
MNADQEQEKVTLEKRRIQSPPRHEDTKLSTCHDEARSAEASAFSQG